MFKGKKGQQLARDIGKKNKTFVAGAGLPTPKKAESGGAEASGPAKQDIEAIKVWSRSVVSVLTLQSKNQCGLTTLQTRRLRGDQTEVYKIFNVYKKNYRNVFFTQER